MTETLFDPYEHEAPPALGIVLDEDRGSLPYSLIHGEALVACAGWALGDAEVLLVDAGVTWDAIRDAGEPVVLHDSLCPMTPATFIAECLRRALADDAVVVATRPVTDTVKVVTHSVVGDTVDRDGLVMIASPVVLPPSVVATMTEQPSNDLSVLVAELARTHQVLLVAAPAQAGRVSSTEDVLVLEALTGS